MASSSSNLQDYMQREGALLGGSLDSHSLPKNQNTVVKLLAEPNEMPYKELCKTVEDLPDGKKMNQSQLDGTLYELIRLGYLTSFMENGDVVYMLQVEVGKTPPPQRHEQRLMRKLDLSDLQLGGLSEDDTTPEIKS